MTSNSIRSLKRRLKLSEKNRRIGGLGLGSFWDEPSASVGADGRKILSNLIFSQIDLHRDYFGVVPEIASRAHLEAINGLVDGALKEAGVSFADLDYIEALSSSEYFGLYKGIFARNQFRRRKAHDLYIDLMARNNDRFNDFMTDRLFKPKWLKYGFLGYGMAALGKMKASRRRRRIGNDTFDGKAWSDRFYKRFEPELTQTSSFFNVENMLYNRPYCDDNQYRRDRHSSLKIWLDHIGVQ